MASALVRLKGKEMKGGKEKGEKPEENERMSEVVFTDLATVNKASKWRKEGERIQ